MTRKSTDVLLRSDRVLVAALAVILAAASAAVGAAAANRPPTEEVAVAAVVAKPAAVVAPAPAPMPVAQSAPAKPANATDMAMTQLLAEHRCLSEVMYYEARGEGRDGQMAVAEVIFHRLRHGQYGHSICAVVYEGAGTHGCQFSFTCNGELAVHKQPAAWRSAEALAARILTGEVTLHDITGNATHFHAISVAPDWADDMERTVQIGNHVFYRHAPRSRAL